MAASTMDCPECGTELELNDIEQKTGCPHFRCSYCDGRFARSDPGKTGEKVSEVWKRVRRALSGGR